MSVLIPLCYSNTAFIETKIEQLLSFQMNTEKLSIHVMMIAILKTKKPVSCHCSSIIQYN